MIGIGGFLANWIGYACGFAQFGQFQWRFPLALQIPPGILLFLGLCFTLPESPRWLISVGRDKEAMSAFGQIRGDLGEKELQEEFGAMREQILFEQRSEVKSLSAAWAKYKKRVRLLSSLLPPISCSLAS